VARSELRSIYKEDPSCQNDANETQNTVVKSAKALPRWTSFEEMVETVIRGKGETSKILTKQIEIFGVQEQLDNLNRLIPHFFAASQFMDRLTVAESENTELLSGETTSFCHLQQTAKSFHKNIQTLFELRMELRVYTAKIRQNMGFLDDTDVLKSKLASEDWKTRMLNGYIQPALTDHLEGQSTHNARLGGAISTRNLMSMKTAMTLTQP